MNPLLFAALLQPEGATGRETAFQRMAAPPLEGVPGGMLLVAAYATTWVLLALFLVLSWRRQQRLAAQIAEMERRLAAPAKESTR